MKREAGWVGVDTCHTPVTWVKHGGVSVSDVCTFHPNRVVLVLIKYQFISRFQILPKKSGW